MHPKRALLMALLIALSVFCGPAAAFHGTAITIRPTAEVEIVVAFDPEDVAGASRDYMISPYGFFRDALSTAVANEEILRTVQSSLIVFLDFGEDGSVVYSASRASSGGWESIDPVDYNAPAGNRMFADVVCSALLGINCSNHGQAAASDRVAFDRQRLDSLSTLPLASIGSFPPDSIASLNVYSREEEVSTALDIMEAQSRMRVGERFPDDLRISGSPTDAIDYFARNETLAPPPDALDTPQEVPLQPDAQQDSVAPFERQGALREIEIAPGYDQRLRYIVLHCTGPGVMPEATIRRYAAEQKRNKAHGYIMPDGSYIAIASIKDNPNKTYATKTETCLRNKAFGTMFNIELNYDCDWRPQKSGAPTEAMLDRLAEVVVWIHQNVGSLGIVAHTYVDMGLRDGHTDPQANPGFDWTAFYESIEAAGGDLSGIERVDPAFAKTWPISQTDRAHRFPPVLEGHLSTGRDECRRYADN